MFSVCHCVILLHPSQTFDVSYIRPFRLATQLLKQLEPHIRERLSNTEHFSSTARLAIPKLLFVFQSNSASMHLPLKKGRHGFVTQCKHLAVEMESQVFHIMRKCRLLPKHHGVHALAYLPRLNDVRDPFVLFMDGRAIPSTDHPTTKHVDTAQYYISQLSATSPQYTEHNDEVILNSFIKRNVAAIFNQNETCLPEELVGQPLYLPPLSAWLSAADSLYSLLCVEEEVWAEPALVKITQQLDPDGMYSESRCQKALPIATSTYMDNLPSHYTKAFHEAQLVNALAALKSRARGPGYEAHATRLEKECNAVWSSAKHACESVSLTGNACVLPLHDDERSHSNRLRMRSACSCGRSMSYRTDPFTLISANTEFYSSLTEKCCSTLAQTRTIGPPDLRWSVAVLGPTTGYQTNTGVEHPGFLPGTQLLLPWDLPAEDCPQDAKRAWNKRNARCYVGYEYECSKGHRFFCSGGGVPVKCTTANILKEGAGAALVSGDCQLYTNCPSHTSKPLLAQLMRLYVCAPEGVPMSLRPIIVYRGNMIDLTANDAINLAPGKISVVRLPYVYCDPDRAPLPLDLEAHLRRCPLAPSKYRKNKGKPS